MAWIIRNSVTEKLAADLAALTGESKTEAVKKALADRLAVLRRRGPRYKASVKELLAIANRAAAHVQRPYLDDAELLYDERGLPK
jgi:antitoxin VapB